MRTIFLFLFLVTSLLCDGQTNEAANGYLKSGCGKDANKNYMGAIMDFNKAIEIEPTALAYFLRGLSKNHLEDYRGCIADMTKAIEIEPFGKAYLSRGVAKIIIGQKESGCLDLSKAGELGEEEAYNGIRKLCN